MSVARGGGGGKERGWRRGVLLRVAGGTRAAACPADRRGTRSDRRKGARKRRQAAWWTDDMGSLTSGFAALTEVRAYHNCKSKRELTFKKSKKQEHTRNMWLVQAAPFKYDALSSFVKRSVPSASNSLKSWTQREQFLL